MIQIDTGIAKMSKRKELYYISSETTTQMAYSPKVSTLRSLGVRPLDLVSSLRFFVNRDSRFCEGVVS